MINQTKRFAQALIDYYQKHQHIGHSYACLTTNSERMPRYLVSNVKQALWFKRANVNVNPDDILSPKSFLDLVDKNGDAGDDRPLIVDHFVMTKTMQELINCINKLEMEVASVCIAKANVKNDFDFVQRANADLLKEVEVYRNMIDKFNKLSFTEKLKFASKPDEFLAALKAQIESELDEATESKTIDKR